MCKAKSAPQRQITQSTTPGCSTRRIFNSISGSSCSEDAEVFTPEYIERDREGKRTNTYRFFSPNAGQFQCSLTNFVFVMEDHDSCVVWVRYSLQGPCTTLNVLKVQRQHKENTYFQTTSSCNLVHGREYTLCCQPEGFEVQPQGHVFECNFGPNYHPTFEVFMDVETEEFKMGVMDIFEENEVWRTRRIILRAPSSNTDTADLRMITEFVDNHRQELIARVTSVMPVADGLRGRHMIPPEMYSDIDVARSRQTKMRLLFNVLDSGGPAVKAEFYRLIKDTEPCLVQDLESGC